MIQTNPEHEDLTKLEKGHPTETRVGNLPQPQPGTRLRGRIAHQRIHLPLPQTGQPDFAEIFIRYVPDQKIVESKSLKLYLWTYREDGVFH